jgi:hypothetical protein
VQTPNTPYHRDAHNLKEINKQWCMQCSRTVESIRLQNLSMGQTPRRFFKRDQREMGAARFGMDELLEEAGLGSGESVGGEKREELRINCEGWLGQ